MELCHLTNSNEWQYFAKGKANVLFKYVGTHPGFCRKLLRVRLAKHPRQYITTQETYDFVQTHCKWRFPDNILEMLLVTLTRDFVGGLALSCDGLMVSEPHGLLIPNMVDGEYHKQILSKHCSLYHNSSFTSIVLELKPKWLYDNTRNYCRTCLLNQLKRLARHFCPLDLINHHTILVGIEDILSKLPKDLYHTIQQHIPLRQLLTNYLEQTDNIFQKLKYHQTIYDSQDLVENVTCADDVSFTLLMAMCLRDVGVFLTIDADHIKPTIYDMDLKSKNRFQHWVDIEQQLQPIYSTTNPEWRYCTKPL